jgi:hypothetical protein
LVAARVSSIKVVGIESRLAPDKGTARFGYVGAILLGGMQALF